MSRHPALLSSVLCLVAALAAAGGRPAPQTPVIPTPKHVAFNRGQFELDQYGIVLVSGKATLATRRAARVIQLGLRERFGADLPIVRIGDKRKHGAAKSIWIVEPRLGRSPANTIGVKDLEFGEEMRAEGYFLRVDAIEIVVHAASDAGSSHGAQTLLQLFRPPQKGTLFRKPRGPTIPCLWVRDWPSRPARVVPSGIPVPSDPEGAERFVRAVAHYKLNGIATRALPTDAATLERVREIAERHPIRFVEQAGTLGAGPLAQLAAAWLGEGRSDWALAACAEAAWGSPDTDPESLCLRLGIPPPSSPARDR